MCETETVSREDKVCMKLEYTEFHIYSVSSADCSEPIHKIETWEVKEAEQKVENTYSYTEVNMQRTESASL